MLRLALGLPLGLALGLLLVASACSSADDPDPIEACEPGADPVWVQEGDTATATISCRGAGEAPAGLEMPNLPAGAVFDAATATLTWTTALDQAAVWHLDILVLDSQEVGTLTVGVADAFDDPSNVAVLDPAAYTHEFGVPVLFLDPGPSQSDVDEPVVVTYGGRTIAGRGELRGASSLSYPKNSYLLKFGNDAQFYDIDRGFVGKRRIVLTSTFDDNAYVRQRLVFELWNALEPSLPLEAYSVVVYLGGEFWGLYTLTDHPGNHWLESLGHSEQSNLYKAYNHDANFRDTDANGNAKSTLHQGLEKKLGTVDDWTDIDDLVSFAINASDADYRSQLADRIHTDDYDKWWQLVVFTLATDSAGKNSYHHRDGGRFAVVPWDFNASFGQSWETSRLPATSVDFYEGRNELFRRTLADGQLGPALRDSLRQSIETGVFSVSELDARIESVVTEIDAVSRRDWRKWSGDYASHPRWSGRSDMTDYDGELAYLRDWVAARRQIVLDAL